MAGPARSARQVRNVAIVGAGTSGSALACLLRLRGIECVVFDEGKTPDLLVGESLVPAGMPLLERLGVLDEVTSFSQKKCGAAFRNQRGDRVDFRFRRFGRSFPDHAFNVPRPRFDLALRKRAAALGARLVHARAEVERSDDPERELRLSDAALQRASLKRQPDLLIDASGRARLFSRILGLGADKGPRNDIAHFAHFEHFASDGAFEGQVVLTALERGWTWQIPLPDRCSVGFVMDKRVARGFGSSPAQRLENMIESTPLLRAAGLKRHRVSDVKVYSNYQLLATKAHGPGWVLVGDALGFVDPMLSPGVFMALSSAFSLDDTVFRHPGKNMQTSLNAFYAQAQDWHKGWSSLSEYFYDGRLLSLGRVRNHIQREAHPLSPARLAELYVSRVLAQLIGGISTRSAWHQSVLHHSSRFLLRDDDQVASRAIGTSYPWRRRDSNPTRAPHRDNAFTSTALLGDSRQP